MVKNSRNGDGGLTKTVLEFLGGPGDGWKEMEVLGSGKKGDMVRFKMVDGRWATYSRSGRNSDTGKVTYRFSGFSESTGKGAMA